MTACLFGEQEKLGKAGNLSIKVALWLGDAREALAKMALIELRKPVSERVIYLEGSLFPEPHQAPVTLLTEVLANIPEFRPFASLMRRMAVMGEPHATVNLKKNGAPISGSSLPDVTWADIEPAGYQHVRLTDSWYRQIIGPDGRNLTAEAFKIKHALYGGVKALFMDTDETNDLLKVLGPTYTEGPPCWKQEVDFSGFTPLGWQRLADLFMVPKIDRTRVADPAYFTGLEHEVRVREIPMCCAALGGEFEKSQALRDEFDGRSHLPAPAEDAPIPGAVEFMP